MIEGQSEATSAAGAAKESPAPSSGARGARGTEPAVAGAGREGGEWRYRDLYEKAPVMMQSVDRRARLIRVNETWLRVMGYTRAAVIGRPFTDFLSPESRAYALSSVIPQFFRTGLTHEAPYSFIKATGEVIEVLVSAFGARNDAGEVVEGIAVIIEVTAQKRAERESRALNAELERRVAERTEALTAANRALRAEIAERRQAEDALRQREEILNAVFDSASDPIFVKDRAGRYIMANRATADAMGLSREALIGHSDREVAPAETAAIIEAGDRLLLETGHKQAFEEALDFGAGVTSRLTTKSPYHNGRGEVIGIVGVSQDITSLKAAEQELRTSEQRMRVITDALPACISYVDSEERYRFVNRTYEDWFLVPRAQIIGLRLRDLLAERDYERSKPFIEAALAGHRVRGQRRGDYPSGERHVDFTCVPDIDESGAVRGFFGWITDITAQKEAEAKESQRHSELAHVARLGTMGEMASALAHELNQPLAAINNYARGSQRRLGTFAEPGASEFRYALEQISFQANRASQIIAHIGKFVRKSTRRTAQADINKVILSAWSLVEAEARDQVDVGFDLAAGLPAVAVNQIEIEQVLLNLFRNANDAMRGAPRPKRRIHVASALGSAGIEVRIADRGCGLPPDEAERIFDAFFTTKRNGMGMGLSISRTIIEAHGGRIWAMPNGEVGTVVAFSLPLVAPHAADL